MAHKYAFRNGETPSVIVPDAITPQFEGIEKKHVKCVSQFTGLAIPENPTERQVQKLALMTSGMIRLLGLNVRESAARTMVLK